MQRAGECRGGWVPNVDAIIDSVSLMIHSSQRGKRHLPNPLDAFNSKIFAEQLHTKFKVLVTGQPPVELELIEVNERETAPKLELFTLGFKGPSALRLDQRIHHLEHEKLGSFELFLTAVGAEQDGLVYEAVFHRFRKPQS